MLSTLQIRDWSIPGHCQLLHPETIVSAPAADPGEMLQHPSYRHLSLVPTRSPSPTPVLAQVVVDDSSHTPPAQPGPWMSPPQCHPGSTNRAVPGPKAAILLQRRSSVLQLSRLPELRHSRASPLILGSDPKYCNACNPKRDLAWGEFCVGGFMCVQCCAPQLLWWIYYFFYSESPPVFVEVWVCS